jgi:hypothetical protein
MKRDIFKLILLAFSNVSDEVTFDLSNSTDLNSIDHYVWNKRKQLLYKFQKEPFQLLKLLQHSI